MPPGRDDSLKRYPRSLLRIATSLPSGGSKHGSISGSSAGLTGRTGPSCGQYRPEHLTEQGVFGIRAPDRPNPVAICMVDLISVDGGVLKVRGLDALDGTPVIDIKVYSPDLDCVRNNGV